MLYLKEWVVPRAFGKGYLKLSFLTYTVKLTPATGDSGKVRFPT
ncbi:hypothetical protein CES85_2954 (plasmid) [Ochrobactrum quorumnocens]|uniref:Uncharacterized protein n=1 Tax=Ochrobactrum quorumnocens TaxID=271865 RepID=A0A248UP56_9HYPH|nr:hypothetical protein CES85_2954 [[Ochrobactrum] quorumnocens]